MVFMYLFEHIADEINEIEEDGSSRLSCFITYSNAFLLTVPFYFVCMFNYLLNIEKRLEINNSAHNNSVRARGNQLNSFNNEI